LKTKEKIIAATLKLFNEQGVENVTTRTVASFLDISQGNLHYHFPNKNCLIEQLYSDFKTGLQDRSGYKTGAFGLQEIHESLHRNFSWMFQYRFLFLDREMVWRRLQNIKRETQAFIIIKDKQLTQAISILQELGVFRLDIDSLQVKSFINMYQVMVNSWLTAVYLFPGKEPEVFFANQAFNMWYPYLTTKGQRQFNAIVESLTK